MAGRQDPDAVRVTTAPVTAAEEQRGRQRRYLISMGIRTLCFVLAVVSIGHWFMWVFLLASLVLPPVAVIIANANAPTDPGGPDWFEPDPTTRAIEGGPATPHEAP